MKIHFLRFALYATLVYLTGFTLNSAATASPPFQSGRHFCGFDDWQPDNRRYARSFAENLNVGEPFTVRVIYFIPNDREPVPNMGEKLDTLIKDAQRFYADQMEAHGFGRKTFRFEADKIGNVVVHHVNGKFNDAYYQNPATGSWIVWEEIEEQFDMSKNIYLLALDISGFLEGPVADGGPTVYGRGSGVSLSGRALIPTVSFAAASHELGHAFGLMHDIRINANRIATDPSDRDFMTTSFCAAEWLYVHR